MDPTRMRVTGTLTGGRAPEPSRPATRAARRNLAELFARHLDEPDRVLWRHFTDGAWRDVTVGEMAALAARWQSAFRRHGCVAGDRVGIAMRNGPAWVAFDLAALGIGLVVVPFHAEDNPGNLVYCMQDAGVRLVLVENQRMRAAIVAAGGTDPLLVVHDGTGAPEDATVERFLPTTPLPFEVAWVAHDTLATICYTSGTSGRPKGVMLSHGNVLANLESIERLKIARPSDVLLSFLPLSHMFERTGGYYLPLAVGAKVVYARGITQLGEDLASERPTVIFAVPRVFEKLAQRVRASFAAPAWKRALLDACVARGWRVVCGRGTPLDRALVPLLRRVVGRPVLDRLGGRLRVAVLGGAALEPHVPELFMALGLPILQGYGMTEASPVISVNTLWDNDPASVGPPLPGVEVRLAAGNEIIAKGANVMLGYWRNPEATAAAIDAAGWLHTGDLGALVDGKLHIRGRLKDVMVLANGEKLPPQDAELAILADPVFDQVMLVGEGRPFLTLVAVTRERDERVIVRRANDRLRDFPRWVRVRRAILSTEPWTVENGLVTPTTKVRRERVAAAFAEAIARVYAAERGSPGA
jgi:long-chain acyl-CoA synthetase